MTPRAAPSILADMLPQWIIEKKRDGHSLAENEIRWFVDSYARGRIPDYQMAALAMAIYFRGMSFDETAVLTDAMMRSGAILDTSAIRPPKIDKHSTGGIGDKVSLILAPLVVCCGVAVPMIAGRGLGLTGGTIDKLEAIPGYKTGLDVRSFLRVVRSCGCSIVSQTARLAPADRKLYALRDVTGTVPSIPLIAASIMSKKLAEGVDGLVLDVKCGSGAFMKDIKSARSLARTMVEIGRRMKKRMLAVITDMSEPLGRSVGNAVEVIEAVETLRGKGPSDLVEITLRLAGHILILGGKARSLPESRRMLLAHLSNGNALRKLRVMVALHGGDERALDSFSRLPSASLKADLLAPKSGYVAAVNADLIGRACLALGAGRSRVGEDIDHAVGITDLVKVGEKIEKRQPLLRLLANDGRRLAAAKEFAAGAVSISRVRPRPRKLILDTI